MSIDHLITDVSIKALIQQNGSVLLIKEPDGQFALPGGRMNVGEQPRDTLYREVFEEIGLKIEAGDLFDCFAFKSKSGTQHFVIVFLARLLENIEAAKLDKEEVVSVEWIPLSKISTLSLRGEYRSILDQLV